MQIMHVEYSNQVKSVYWKSNKLKTENKSQFINKKYNEVNKKYINKQNKQHNVKIMYFLSPLREWEACMTVKYIVYYLTFFFYLPFVLVKLLQMKVLGCKQQIVQKQTPH